MAGMRAKDDALLLKAEAWTPPPMRISKLEEVKSSIFHLRYNRGLSYNAIRRFLADSGIKTSTAALSKYFRSRFAPGSTDTMKQTVVSRLDELKAAPKKS
jgi:hypothetical protein